MKIDLVAQIVHKAQGKNTPAAQIPFHCLRCYLALYNREIDTESAIKAIANWRNTGQKTTDVLNVLESVIVTFGGGHRIWGKYSNYYFKHLNLVNEQLKHIFQKTSIYDALNAAKMIKGLGESYASKLLRFVSSDFVVLDSILREELCGTMPYSNFRDLCSQIATAIGLTPVDVEASLFTFVQLAKPQQKKWMWRQYQILNKSSGGFAVCRCPQKPAELAESSVTENAPKLTDDASPPRPQKLEPNKKHETRHAYALQITNTRDVIFGIKEFNGGEKLIGYIYKGLKDKEAGTIIAYERLREIFSLAKVTKQPEARATPDGASKFGNPTTQNTHWRAFDVSTYQKHPLSATAHLETASTKHHRKAHDAFRFLEHYFTVQYTKS